MNHVEYRLGCTPQPWEHDSRYQRFSATGIREEDIEMLQYECHLSGYQLVLHGTWNEDGESTLLLSSSDPYALIEKVGTSGVNRSPDTPQIIHWLKRLEADTFDFHLLSCDRHRLIARLEDPLTEEQADGLASRIVAFCPEVLQSYPHITSEAELSEVMMTTNSFLLSWEKA